MYIFKHHRFRSYYSHRKLSDANEFKDGVLVLIPAAKVGIHSLGMYSYRYCTFIGGTGIFRRYLGTSSMMLKKNTNS